MVSFGRNGQLNPFTGSNKDGLGRLLAIEWDLGSFRDIGLEDRNAVGRVEFAQVLSGLSERGLLALLGLLGEIGFFLPRFPQGFDLARAQQRDHVLGLTLGLTAGEGILRTGQNPV